MNEINTRFKTNRVKTIYTYNEGASPVKIEYFNKNGVLISEATLKNNADGLPIELHNFEPIGTLIGSESANYILNENKAIVSIKSPEGENLFTDTVSINFKNASKFNNPNFKFNEFGDLVFSTTKWFNGSVHFNEYEYKYDEIGNWIDKKCYEVAFNTAGKKKRQLKSHFSRQFIYWKR